jgi:anti-sigma-K factor RskA
MFPEANDSARLDVALRGARTETFDAPPAMLWDRIAEELGEESDNDRRERPRSGSVTPMRWKRPLMAAAAVAGAFALGAGTMAALNGDDSKTDPGRTVMARVALDALKGEGSGEGTMYETSDGLELDLAMTLPKTKGYYEVWLLDANAKRLVSLGPIRPDGRYEVPKGLDPGNFPVVDVSVEDFDGNPAHSGDSLLRGELIV